MNGIVRTHYHHETPERVRQILETFRQTRTVRIKIHYGDASTGKAWGDVDTGYIGRSMGGGPNPIHIPLLVHNSRSMGGPALLDHCIVKLEYANKKDGGVMYQHPTYQEYVDD